MSPKSTPLSQVCGTNRTFVAMLTKDSAYLGFQGRLQYGEDPSGERQEDYRTIRRYERHDQSPSAVSTYASPKWLQILNHNVAGCEPSEIRTI